MKKIVMLILDGFGIRDEEYGNAIKAAKMKNFDNLLKEYPHTFLEASGEHVGLAEGQFGNSEVGHMSIGAGRLVKQNEVLVDEFLEEGYKENIIFQNLLEKSEKNVHIMGLASDGNVHAGIDDFLKIFNILVKHNFKKIYFHLMTDGRDTDMNAGSSFVNEIQQEIKKHKVGHIASISGRYFGMDRDKNFDRTKKYYDLVVRGIGIGYIDPVKALDSFYKKGYTDEFINPMVSVERKPIENGDVVIWMNYRADRSKQILSSLKKPDFDEFPTKKLDELEVYSFFENDKNIDVSHFITPPEIKNALGLYLSDLGLSQARIAESEKFPHVTYFFDGGIDAKIPGCDKFHIPSEKIETFDLKPEMSIVPVTKQAIMAMQQDYDFILINFANPDMVGHTGNMEAATRACMAVDVCLGKIMEEVENNFYTLVLLADHGNAEDMLYKDGRKKTTHTTSKVPFVITDKKINLKKEGGLTMVAPTVLSYMDIALPDEMLETETLFLEN